MTGSAAAATVLTAASSASPQAERRRANEADTAMKPDVRTVRRGRTMREGFVLVMRM
jgi:hypothetical protein